MRQYLARIPVFLVATAGLVLIAGSGQPAFAAQIAIHTDVIYASNDQTGRSPELRAFGADLPYNSLELIERKSFLLDFATDAQVNVPGGGILRIRPEGYDGSMIRVKVWMEKASKYKLDMILQIANGGTVVVAGPSHKNGTILIPISARMK